MAKIKDNIPFFVVIQIIIATKDNIPHQISNLVIFQYDFLLKKEAVITNNGENPAIKVERSNGVLTPDLYPIYVPTRGAIAQKIHDTIFGLVLPYKVSFM